VRADKAAVKFPIRNNRSTNKKPQQHIEKLKTRLLKSKAKEDSCQASLFDSDDESSSGEENVKPTLRTLKKRGPNITNPMLACQKKRGKVKGG